MNTRVLVVLLTSFAANGAWAEACMVETRAQSAAVPMVEGKSCYEYKGVPAGSIDWSCSNESKETLTSQKKKVASCPQNAVGTCKATLTQESMANQHSSSKDSQAESANIPKGAQILTYYYDLKDQSQARTDCEKAGGQWQTE
ncbi:hypothetical protein [Pseudomonas turukhanskensis]|uniref:Uncharacterized protein n=1 Tax=Pseudomonas turukhanskensis TaxID=1806536 RepID=A0A9W6K7X0_9PSED|nr:hypothetical protein [Pseudomonas turukhanskensis]GLK89345.1 hypothetical protein GCM10017655_24070 [Pseudomonas turukhanskensis]